MPHVLVWDIETVPDLAGFAAANGHEGKTEDEIRAELGDKFPKHIYHSIICIGALIAHQQDDHWVVDALGAPHVGDRSERELIAAFVARIAELNPQLVTFNGSSFDLPVLRYRAMVHKVPAIGLSTRPYFKRYTDDAIDLCDVLSSFSHGAKSTLHELRRVMGLPGKPVGIDGAHVAQFYRDGRIREIADYCERDVVNTYRLWLRHELFQGNLIDAAFQASEEHLDQFISKRRAA
jgi:3'-5' exonuclease